MACVSWPWLVAIAVGGWLGINLALLTAAALFFPDPDGGDTLLYTPDRHTPRALDECDFRIEPYCHDPDALAGAGPGWGGAA
jgi:hypothetical protein